MSKRIRYSAVLLAVAVLIFSFAAAFFALHEYNHECGENCPICAAGVFLKTVFKSVYIAFYVSAAVAAFSFALKPLSDLTSFLKNTPVMLKVKMTD